MDKEVILTEGYANAYKLMRSIKQFMALADDPDCCEKDLYDAYNEVAAYCYDVRKLAE